MILKFQNIILQINFVQNRCVIITNKNKRAMSDGYINVLLLLLLVHFSCRNYIIRTNKWRTLFIKDEESNSTR